MPRPKSVGVRSPQANEAPQELPAFCADPKCRKRYERAVGPGRPQLYCSEMCRRRAQNDLRQLESRLRHFEGVVQQLRADVAVHAPEDGNVSTPDEVRRKAELGVARAGGLVPTLSDRDDHLAVELRRLYEAVAPLFSEQSTAAS